MTLLSQILTKKGSLLSGRSARLRFFSSPPKNDSFLPHQVDPATGELIKASFTRVEETTKNQFPNAHCIVSLSIGQPVHEGAHLAATLSLVDKSFGSCTFVLGDTLQRHTMAITHPSLSREELYQKTKAEGDHWIRRNSPVLAQLRIPYGVKRWNYWLEHPRFNDLLKWTQQNYSLEADYKQSFENNIQEYLDRLTKRGELHVPVEVARAQCLKYLQEECAAMCLWLNEKGQFELYPSGRTPAMQATYDRFLKTLHPDLLNPISLRFKKVAAPKDVFLQEATDATPTFKHSV